CAGPFQSVPRNPRTRRRLSRATRAPNPARTRTAIGWPRGWALDAAKPPNSRLADPGGLNASDAHATALAERDEPCEPRPTADAPRELTELDHVIPDLQHRQAHLEHQPDGGGAAEQPERRHQQEVHEPEPHPL